MHFHVVDFLFSISTIEAVASIVAFVLVLRNFRSKPSFYAMAIFYGHLALYWNFILFARIFGGYVGPSLWASTWGAAVFLHASLAIIGDALARRANGKG